MQNASNNAANAANNAANNTAETANVFAFEYWQEGVEVELKVLRTAAVATQFSEGRKQIAVTTAEKFVGMNGDGDFAEVNTLWFYPSVLFDALEQSLHNEDDRYTIARVRALADAEKRNDRLRLILIGAKIKVRRQTHAPGEVSDTGRAYEQECFSTRIVSISLGDAGKRVMRQTLAAIEAADMQTFML